MARPDVAAGSIDVMTLTCQVLERLTQTESETQLTTVLESARRFAVTPVIISDWFACIPFAFLLQQSASTPWREIVACESC